MTPTLQKPPYNSLIHMARLVAWMLVVALTGGLIVVAIAFSCIKGLSSAIGIDEAITLLIPGVPALTFAVIKAAAELRLMLLAMSESTTLDEESPAWLVRVFRVGNRVQNAGAYAIEWLVLLGLSLAYLNVAWLFFLGAKGTYDAFVSLSLIALVVPGAAWGVVCVRRVRQFVRYGQTLRAVARQELPKACEGL